MKLAHAARGDVPDDAERRFGRPCGGHKDEAQENYDEAVKLLATNDGEIAVLKKQLADAKITPEKLSEMVKARTGVIDSARNLLSPSYIFDNKDEATIKRDAGALSSRAGTKQGSMIGRDEQSKRGYRDRPTTEKAP